MVDGLATAEAALNRGDYRLCIQLLNKIIGLYPINGKEGSLIRMLMVTALMGMGEEEKAISMCKVITHSKDPDSRERARQLLTVLQAPSLARPDNWSVEIPRIEISSSYTNNFKKSNKTSKKEKSEDYPPTGPTKAFSAGFYLMLMIILISLTLLLSDYI